MAAGKEKKCFVIGTIGAEGSPERTDADWLLDGIVKPALEPDPFNYDVQRADQIAEPGSITDQIIGAVIEADLVVADLTGANPNAFYELAIRHMEQKAVIHMAQKDQSLPFDIRDYRAVLYSRERPCDLEEAKAELRNHVKAVEDTAYQPSNPITKARGVLDLERSGDPKDKILVDLVEGHRRLEARLKMLEPLMVTPGWLGLGGLERTGNTLLTAGESLGSLIRRREGLLHALPAGAKSAPPEGESLGSLIRGREGLLHALPAGAKSAPAGRRRGRVLISSSLPHLTGVPPYPHHLDCGSL